MRLATYIDTDGFGAVGSFMRFGLNSRIGGLPGCADIEPGLGCLPATNFRGEARALEAALQLVRTRTISQFEVREERMPSNKPLPYYTQQSINQPN